MANVQHRDAPLGQRHPSHNWSVASTAAREALVVAAADVGKDCLQTDTNPPTFWRLTRASPPAWINLGAQGMTPEQSAQLSDALAKANALGGQTYVVQSVTSDLTAERALEGADGVTVDFSTPGKAIVRGPSIPASATPADITAHKAPTYIVQTATAALDNERVLAGADGVTIDYGTAGQAIVRGPTIPASATPAQLAALRTPVYIVQTATAELDNERVLTGANGVTIDYATPGQAIVRGPTIPTYAPVAAEYIVAAGEGTLTNERVLSASGGMVVSFATPGQAVIQPGTLLDALNTAMVLKAGVDHDIIEWNTAAKTLALSDRNKLIRATHTAALPILTIPRDSSLNLPIGFTCAVLLDAIGMSPEFVLTVVSESMTGTFGIPARYANPFSHPTTTPAVIYAQPFQRMTLTKLRADAWLVEGNHVP